MDQHVSIGKYSLAWTYFLSHSLQTRTNNEADNQRLQGQAVVICLWQILSNILLANKYELNTFLALTVSGTEDILFTLRVVYFKSFSFWWWEGYSILWLFQLELLEYLLISIRWQLSWKLTVKLMDLRMSFRRSNYILYLIFIEFIVEWIIVSYD